MRRKPQLRNGLRLPPRTPGNLLSGEAQDLLVQLFNAISCGRVEVGNTAEFRLTDNNLLITIPRSAAGGSGSDITLQTNGVNNTVQTLLNLIAGSGITLTADGAGGVTIAASGGIGNMNFRGVWTSAPSTPYMMQDVVVIQSGVSAGTYISVADNNTANPATGIQWVQIAPGNAVGSWL
jgi:hypothetical protein